MRDFTRRHETLVWLGVAWGVLTILIGGAVVLIGLGPGKAIDPVGILLAPLFALIVVGFFALLRYLPIWLAGGGWGDGGWGDGDGGGGDGGGGDGGGGGGGGGDGGG